MMEVAPNDVLEERVNKVLRTIGADFVDLVMDTACKLAKHRSSEQEQSSKDKDRLMEKDIQKAVQFLFEKRFVQPADVLQDITPEVTSKRART